MQDVEKSRCERQEAVDVSRYESGMLPAAQAAAARHLGRWPMDEIVEGIITGHHGFRGGCAVEMGMGCTGFVAALLDN